MTIINNVVKACVCNEETCKFQRFGASSDL